MVQLLATNSNGILLAIKHGTSEYSSTRKKQEIREFYEMEFYIINGLSATQFFFYGVGFMYGELCRWILR